MKTVGLFLLLTLPLTAPVFADIIITQGNDPLSNGQNVLLDAGQGNELIGTTNKTGTPVIFSSTTDELIASASGQANLTASDGWINEITIKLLDGSNYLGLIFDVSGIEKRTETEITIKVNNGLGEAFELGNGSNFFTIAATEGDLISSTTFLDTKIQELRQVRISGIPDPEDPAGGGSTSAVPEPASLLLLGSGLSVLGVAAWRRKK